MKNQTAAALGRKAERAERLAKLINVANASAIALAVLLVIAGVLAWRANDVATQDAERASNRATFWSAIADPKGRPTDPAGRFGTDLGRFVAAESERPSSPLLPSRLEELGEVLEAYGEAEGATGIDMFDWDSDDGDIKGLEADFIADIRAVANGKHIDSGKPDAPVAPVRGLYLILGAVATAALAALTGLRFAGCEARAWRLRDAAITAGRLEQKLSHPFAAEILQLESLIEAARKVASSEADTAIQRAEVALAKLRKTPALLEDDRNARAAAALDRATTDALELIEARREAHAELS